MSAVTIELDFTGHSPAGVGIGYLSTGLHEAKLVEFRHYDDSNRLYAYMVTDGIRHRDSFSLSEKAMPFLMAFLISAGIPEDKLQGKISFPFDKLTGKSVYFNYTAPTMGANGQPVDGSYAEYRFVTKGYFTQMKKAQAAPAPADFEVEIKSANGAGNPVASDDGFDFLLKTPAE